MKYWGDAVHVSRGFTVSPLLEEKPDGTVAVLYYGVTGPSTDDRTFPTSAAAIAFAKECANDPHLRRF
jgi:hypothetical protein